ncbi:hypothetical protein QL285_018129 [Trifolium repens]|nr:hypothetical protein QL285_018129 [Trifolium repens]
MLFNSINPSVRSLFPLLLVFPIVISAAADLFHDSPKVFHGPPKVDVSVPVLLFTSPPSLNISRLSFMCVMLKAPQCNVSLTKRVNNRGSCCQAKNNDDDDEIPSWIKPSKEMDYLAKLLKYYEPIKDINGFFTTFVSLYNFVAFMYKCLTRLQRLLKTKKKTEGKNGEEEVDKEETKKDEGKQEKKETNEEANKDDENDEVNEGKKMDYDWDDVAKVTLIFKVQILIQVHLVLKQRERNSA